MFKPLNDHILVKPDEAKNETEFGFILPEKAKELPVSGEIEVGSKSLKKGQRILFSRYGFDEVKIEKQTYYVVAESAVLGIFE